MFPARLILCSLVLSSSLTAYAAIWGERGDPREVLTRGSLAYAADGRGVAVYDFSDPTHITAIDIESRHAETTDAAFLGDHDLVTATTIGVERFTIDADGTLRFTGYLPSEHAITMVAGNATIGAAASGRDVTLFEPTPEGLRAISTTMMSNDVLALAFVGEFLYVSVASRGTYVYRTPSMEQLTVIAQTANDFELSGKTLWGSAPAGGIAAFNVNNAAAPQRVSMTEVETQFDDVAIAGTRVYARTLSGEVYVLNGASATSPQRISTIDAHAESIATTASSLITSRRAMPLRIFDAANIVTGDLADLAGPVSGVWTDGSLAYVIDAPYLRVLDVSKTDEPRELSAIGIDDIQPRIRVKNGLAVLYGDEFVNIVDVTHPLHPRHIGTWDTDGLPPSNAAIANGRIVEANNHSGLHVLDYSDPQHAVQIGGRKWHYLDMAAADDVIYALQDGFFIVLEIVDQRSIAEHGFYTVHAGTNIEIVPPNASVPQFVVTRSLTNVQIYDVREDRFSPELIAELPLEGTGNIATNETTMYLAQNGTLQTIDVASPDSFVDTGMEVTDAMQISVAGEKVVVADRYRVRVYGPDTDSPVPAPAPPTRRRAVSH